MVLEKEGPNDGLVSVESSKWVHFTRVDNVCTETYFDLQGTYLGTLEDVNHLDLVGWINPARYKWAEFTGREIKFKPATFYLGIVDHLARVVEGQKNEGENTNDDSAEGTRAGEGVTTMEGVEAIGPKNNPPTNSTC